MRRRRWAFALAWLSSLGFASWSGAAPEQDPAKDATRFTHETHVMRGWARGDWPELWRDCRGCHDYTESRQVSAPQEHCDACHAPAGGSGKLERRFAPGWEKDLAPYRTRTRDAFRHHTHLMLECRECHAPPPGSRVAGSDYDIVTGPGQCARCHEAAALAADDHAQIANMRWFAGARDPATAAELGMKPFTPPDRAGYKAFADRLVEVFGGAAGALNVGATQLQPGGAFDHTDHGGMACAACHADVPTARADQLGTGAIAKAECARCHADGEGKPLSLSPPREEPRRQQSVGAFAHADHYRFLQPGQQRRTGVANEAAYTALAAPGGGSCRHCHMQDPAAVGNAKDDHPFVDEAGRPTGFGRQRYLDCVVCHDGQGWSTGETAAAPLHDSSDGAADGRGAGASNTAGPRGFDACSACHDGGGAGFFAVPAVQVERIRDAVFLFGGQTHPYIGPGPDGQRPDLQDCAKCHRGRVPELPSRLERRPFRHAVHLSAKPTAQDCLVCHPSAGVATKSQGLAVDFRTYSPQACGGCHLGAQVLEAGAEPLRARGESLAALAARTSTVEFDHAAHGRSVACADCHALAADGRDIVTQKGALDCTQCHDHDAGKGVDTKGAERLFGEPVQSCARCHAADPAQVAAGGRKADVPPRRGSPASLVDPRHVASQQRLVGFAAAQFHPTDRRCTDCHTAELRPDPKWPGRRVPRKDHLFVGERAHPHVGQGTNLQPTNCLACHWITTTKTGYAGGVPITGDRELDAARRDPGGDAARARFGNKRRGYPGKPDADG